MASLNLVCIIGNLGKDPEVKFTPSGDAVCNFSVAASEKWKSKDGTEQERTEWFRCTAWRKTAEVCGQYLKKGSSVYVQGKLQTREYEKDGQKRYATEVQVERVQFLSGKKDAGGGQDETRGAAPAAAAGDDSLPF